MKKIQPPYDNPFGVWTVTTEGDEEGKRVRHLGTYRGFVDEIALALADRSFYSLKFSSSRELDMAPVADKVSVSFDIDSGTWDMNSEDRADVVAEVFKDRDVSIGAGQYYASFIISKEMTEDERVRSLSKKIREKLNAEELEFFEFLLKGDV